MLEQILLDENERPLVSFDKYGKVFGQLSVRSNLRARHELSAPDDVSSSLPILTSTEDEHFHEAQNYEIEDEERDRPARVYDRSQEPVYGLESDYSEYINEEHSLKNGLERALPSTEVLLAVVQYFCSSFHHWFPFLHKARWTRQVEEGSMDSGDLLVLHAATAVALQRVKMEGAFSTRENAQNKAKASRALVIKHAMFEMSLKSLMALVILIFNDVSYLILKSAKSNKTTI